jgi:hypothetical protein
MEYLSYDERREKLYYVAVVFGYAHAIDLLNAYKHSDVVPGICTRHGCNFMTNVEQHTDAHWCANGHGFSVASILKIAGVV